MKLSLKSGLEKTGLPLIITSRAPQGLCFLIDTSATHNTLFKSVCNDFTIRYIHFKGDERIICLHFEEGDCYPIFRILYYVPEAIQQVQEKTGAQIHGILIFITIS